MANEQLHNAKSAKADEFYTDFHDIEAEINAYQKSIFENKTVLCPCDDPGKSAFTKFFLARFSDFKLKALICTSYAHSYLSQNPSEREKQMGCYNPEKQFTNGRVYKITSSDIIPMNMEDVEWKYLNGDGDFRSDEVTKLRDESDIIVSNGPFSLFREFLAWILAGNKLFSIIGNINAVTYKEVFPLIKDNIIWLGASIHSGDRKFYVPDDYPLNASGCGIDADGKRFIRVKGVRWFTNIDHGERHEPLQLMTMEDNLKYNKPLQKKLLKEYGEVRYQEYDNYTAIEIPQTNAIPSDYEGIMGVPITFLDKYCPEQFELLNANDFRKSINVPEKPHGLIKDKEATITYEKVLDNNGMSMHDLTTGNRQQGQPMPEYVSETELLAPGADGWHINGKRKYARIFIRKL